MRCEPSQRVASGCACVATRCACGATRCIGPCVRCNAPVLEPHPRRVPREHAVPPDGPDHVGRVRQPERACAQAALRLASCASVLQRCLARCTLARRILTAWMAVCMLCESSTGCCLLHAACGVLHAACCALQFACCMLHAACCALQFACCMLHAACCRLRVAGCMLQNLIRPDRSWCRCGRSSAQSWRWRGSVGSPRARRRKRTARKYIGLNSSSFLEQTSTSP